MQGLNNSRSEFVGELAPIGVISNALFSRKGESRRDRNAQPRHFSEIATLAAKKVAHGGAPFVTVPPEGVNTLVH